VSGGGALCVFALAPRALRWLRLGGFCRYVSNASPVTANGTLSPAYNNQFIALNMTQLFGTTTH
jgi:hypothetical protein